MASDVHHTAITSRRQPWRWLAAGTRRLVVGAGFDPSGSRLGTASGQVPLERAATDLAVGNGFLSSHVGVDLEVTAAVPSSGTDSAKSGIGRIYKISQCGRSFAADIRRVHSRLWRVCRFGCGYGLCMTTGRIRSRL